MSAALRSVRPGFASSFALALLLTAAADFLLFGQPIGISLALFALLLGCGVAAVNGKAAFRSLALLCAGLLPLVENNSPLSACVAFVCLAAYALASSRRLKHGLGHVAGQLLGFLAALPFRLPLDLAASRRAAGRRNGGSREAALLVWVMPLALASLFAFLFGIANPVIAHWLSLIDLFALLDWERIAFWIPVLAAVWMFLRPRLRLGSRPAKPASLPLPPSLPATEPVSDRLRQLLFGPAAILRALLVFNALFAVQTLLDAAYLWGGVALPDGLTYAGYAHRGAYPLVATALLAAAFVLLATRPGSAAAADRRIRALVILWTAQNIALVLSSILRLDLYVGIYSLTYWRVAAFLWMGLVALGLALILARIVLHRSNRWLVNANLGALFLALYACCFLDFAGLIADFNVAHSHETGGEGRDLDAWYLASLGPQALPAIDRFLAQARTPPETYPRPFLRGRRVHLEAEHLARSVEWRAWTFRGWRLSRMLAQDPGPVPR